MSLRGAVSDPFEHDDAAYLLGALDRADREAFEAHLAQCAACTARVAALRPVAVALGSGGDEVRHALVLSLESEPESAQTAPAPQADHVTDLIRLVERRRRRTRWTVGGLATVAAATIAALAIALATPANPADAVAAQQMTAIGISEVRATAAIAAVPWGSKITIDCSYAGAAPYAQGGVYALEVIDRSGRAHQVGSWTLTQDATARFTSGTALTPDEIRAINVTEPDGTVVLRLSL